MVLFLGEFYGLVHLATTYARMCSGRSGQPPLVIHQLNGLLDVLLSLRAPCVDDRRGVGCAVSHGWGVCSAESAGWMPAVADGGVGGVEGHLRPLRI